MAKVVLACDGSKDSLEAARFLAHLPHDDTLHLAVVSVLHVPAKNRNSISREWIGQCMKQEDENAQQVFATVAKMFEGADAELEHVVKEGHVATTIVDAAHQLKADLLVLGATGRSAISRVLLGSISDYVATHADCSVLTVRPGDEWTGSQPLRVAVAFEDTDTAWSGLEQFCSIDWGREPIIDLVTISPTATAYVNDQREADQKAIDAAAQRVRQVAPNVQTHLINSDHFGEGLVGFTERQECDVIVVAESDRSKVERFLLGSVSRFVLRHATCSVWITRTKTR